MIRYKYIKKINFQKIKRKIIFNSFKMIDHRIEKTNSTHRKHFRNVNQRKYTQVIKRKAYITVKFELEETKTKKKKQDGDLFTNAK